MQILRTIQNFLLGIVFLVISLPLQILLGLILTIEIKEFPIFIQDRGLTLTNGRFKMIKFRTIKSANRNNLSIKTDFLVPTDEKNISTFAGFLRRTGLDELPQLFHVITGQMEIVGPRPLMVPDIEFIKNNFPDFYSERNSFKVKPGITGLWQLYGDKNSGVVDLLKFDIDYEKNHSAVLDLKIIFISFLYVLQGVAKSKKM